MQAYLDTTLQMLNPTVKATLTFDYHVSSDETSHLMKPKQYVLTADTRSENMVQNKLFSKYLFIIIYQK